MVQLELPDQLVLLVVQVAREEPEALVEPEAQVELVELEQREQQELLDRLVLLQVQTSSLYTIIQVPQGARRYIMPPAMLA